VVAWNGIGVYDTAWWYRTDTYGHYYIEYDESSEEGQMPCWHWIGREYESTSNSVYCYNLNRVKIEYDIDTNTEGWPDSSGTVYLDLDAEYEQDVVYYYVKGGEEMCSVWLVHSDDNEDNEILVLADTSGGDCDLDIELDITWQFYWPF